MTLPSIFTTARTLSYYTRKQEVIANNLANATSDGFKVDRITAANADGSAIPVPVHSLDLSQGSLRDTGRMLDLALEGPGFLVVTTPRGERLSRGGSLLIDSEGFLADRNGNRLLGEEGPIHVVGREVIFQADGSVVVDGARAGRLRLENPPESDLLKEGVGLFLAQGEARAAAPDARLRQGTIEEANVNTLLNTVDMIMVQRAYSANLQALRAMDGVMATLTGQIGGR